MKTSPTKQDRALAKTVVSSRGDLRVKFGTTNGQTVLHVRVDGEKAGEKTAFTLKNEGEWATCPLNPTTPQEASA